MSIFRAIFLFLTFLTVALTPAIAAPSGRKIDGVKDGGPDGKVTISRDGRFISMLSLPGEKGSDCFVFDRLTHRTIMIPGSGRMEPLCFSRDGRGLWVWGLWVDSRMPGLRMKPEMKPFIALYDLRKRRYIRKMHGLDADWNVPDGSAMSSDGRSLIFRERGGTINRFSTRTGRLLWSHDEPEECTTTYSEDGKKSLRIYSHGEETLYKLEIAAASTGRVISQLKLPFPADSEATGYASMPRIAPRGSQVAIYKPSKAQWIFMDSRNSRVQWQMGSTPSERFDGDLTWYWSPDASRVAVQGPNGFELRDARTGRVLLHSQQFNAIWSVLSPDNSVLYTFKSGDTNFGDYTSVWQWRLFPTRYQQQADAHYMRNLRRKEAKFALSKPHLNESLLLAANDGDYKRVELLLNRGAYIEALDMHGKTPLQEALSGIPLGYTRSDAPRNGTKTAILLIKRGANVKKHGGALLGSAIDYGEPLIKILLAHGAGINDTTRDDLGGETALNRAAHTRNLPLTRLLLQRGANPKISSNQGMTPMMDLVENLDAGPPPSKEVFQIGQLLIDYGADVNAHDKYGKTALSMCKNKSFKEFLRKVGAKS